MAAAYPSTLVQPQLNGLTIGVGAGVARSDVPGAQVQRRIFATMPHSFTLSFAMTLAQWSDWQAWVKVNAYSWFTMYLPSMYAGLDGLLTTPTLIRFTSPITASNLSQDHIRVSVMAEMAPTMIARFHENT